jgi:hypothetical protein
VILRRALLWTLTPLLLGVILGGALDLQAVPFFGSERLSAVFLLDGEAYFGHLEDIPWSGTLVLRDVYYVNDATKVTTDLPVGLVKRGGELHQPVDVMYIRRDKVLAVERVTAGSPVGLAIAAQRTLDRIAK